MRGWKKILHADGNQKKVGVAILISDKIDCKIKTVTRDKEGHSLPNDQGINPRRTHNKYKYLCTQHRSTSIHKANANSHKRGTKTPQNVQYSGKKKKDNKQKRAEL